MLINSINNMLKELNVSTIITTNDIKQQYFCGVPFDVFVNEDARSAAFFSYGKAQHENHLVALVIYEEQLVHCYSAMTEAMFQHVRFLIVVIHRDESDYSHEYLNSSMIADYTFNSSIVAKIRDIPLNRRGCIIVNVWDRTQSENRDGSFDSGLLWKELPLERVDTVICFDQYCKGIKDRCIIKTFCEEEKYGVISKYMGYLLGCSGRCVLIMPLSYFKYDLNILNNRYLNEHFKVIMIDEAGTENRHMNWIQKNGIRYSECSLRDEQLIANCLQSAGPEICIVRGGEI